METSDQGVRLLMEREGFRNEAYPDPATGGAPWTIGVGHTGPEVHPGLIWSDEEVQQQLHRDLAVYEGAVHRNISADLQQHQFDALVSFTFNLGEAQLASSTLRRLINEGDFVGAAAQFPRWNIPAMIITRRRGEQLQFMGEQFVATSME